MLLWEGWKCPLLFSSPPSLQSWVQDRLPLAMLEDHGNNLQVVQQFIKKNQVPRQRLCSSHLGSPTRGSCRDLQSWEAEPPRKSRLFTHCNAGIRLPEPCPVLASACNLGLLASSVLTAASKGLQACKRESA